MCSEPPCTILDSPIRLRLYIDDVMFMQKMNINPNRFIRELVHMRIKEIRMTDTPTSTMPPC